MVLVDSIITACIELYKKLPKSGKPSSSEWTVITGVVGVFGDDSADGARVLSLGTGSKCIGKSAMSPNGDVLNDSHAEVIARRAFLRYLYLEIARLNETNFSEVFRRDEDGVRVKESVKFYFVTSMSPCGDASIMPKWDSCDETETYGCCLGSPESVDLTNALKRKHPQEEVTSKKVKTDLAEPEISANNAKKAEYGTKKDIHRTGAKCVADSSIQDPHLPGILYHSTGAVRTKPGRGDPTLSLSCSDKIARWNAIGWEGALLSLLIKAPIFVEGIICGSGCPFSKESFDRAVNGRINRKPFVPIHQSEIRFPDMKGEGKRPNPSSLIWWKGGGGAEVSINGRKQGVTKKNLNKKSARTSICKKELFGLFVKVVNGFPDKDKFLSRMFDDESCHLKSVTYGELKSKAVDYRRRWDAVKRECFKVWSNKSADLLKFTLDEET